MPTTMARRLRTGLDSVPGRSAPLHQVPTRMGHLRRDRNLRFHAYDLISPTPNVEALLAHVDEDPTCIFWG
jgi:Protein of unknown function (DUF3024)